MYYTLPYSWWKGETQHLAPEYWRPTTTNSQQKVVTHAECSWALHGRPRSLIARKPSTAFPSCSRWLTAAGGSLSDILTFMTSAPDHASIPRKVGPQPRTLATDPPQRRTFGGLQLHKLCISIATVGTGTLSKRFTAGWFFLLEEF